MIFLKLIEKLFHRLVLLKNLMYDWLLVSSNKLQIPVVSVGNLSFGGVGKTPCVIFLAKEFSKSYKTNIVVKSYKASLRLPAKVDLSLTNATQIFGDEACLIQSKLSMCQVWSGPKKYLTAAASLRDHPQLIVLDDGFSHRKLHRNFDLILVDATQGFNTYLREPLGCLKRAQAILITKTNLSDSETIVEIKKNIIKSMPHLTESIFLSRVKTELKLDIKHPLFVFCGLAQPASFILDLTLQGYKVVRQKFFADHYSYSPAVQLQIYSEYGKLKEYNKELRLVTTEKDLIKITDVLLRKCVSVSEHKIEMDPDQKEALLEKIGLSF